jgi:hypothetical protein
MASSHPPHIRQPLSCPQPEAALPLTSLRIATTPVGETLRDLPGTFSTLAPPLPHSASGAGSHHTSRVSPAADGTRCRRLSSGISPIPFPA